MKRLCIYHNKDLDGFCSGAIVKYKYPEVELFGWDYGEPVPWKEMGQSEEVILVDVSFKLEDMQILAMNPKLHLVWIDHHKSAIEMMNGSGLKIDGCALIGKAACELAWEYYFPQKKTPRPVYLLGRWDVWAWLDSPDKDEIEAFQYGMRAQDTDPKVNMGTWEILFGKVSGPEYLREDTTKAGYTIINYRNQQNALKAQSAFETTIDGHKVLALNGGGGSQTFDSVWDNHPDCEAMLSFFWTGEHWRVSMYSHRGLDCSEICKNHGGGGHQAAAGFTCQELPFKLKN